MAHELERQRLRRGYAALLRLYPKSFRGRFAEPMEHAFADLLRERARGGGRIGLLACRLYLETFARIVGEHVIVIATHKGVVRLVLVTAGLLLVPAIGMLVSDDWQWTLSDFVSAGALIFGTGLAWLLIARKAVATAYRIGIGLALATMFLVVWINAAVGIIGDAPVNVLYYGIPLIGLLGATIARLEPAGMARTLFVMALAMATVPVIALALGTRDFAPGVAGVFVLNGVFVALFATAGALFRRVRA